MSNMLISSAAIKEMSSLSELGLYSKIAFILSYMENTQADINIKAALKNHCDKSFESSWRALKYQGWLKIIRIHNGNHITYHYELRSKPDLTTPSETDIIDKRIQNNIKYEKRN